MAYSWDRNQQGSYTFNVPEDTCKQSENFLSWRTDVAGERKIVVQSREECLSHITNQTTARYLGNEQLLDADYRSSCNGIVDDHNYEKLFSKPIQMLGAEADRVSERQPTLDACAIAAFTYYEAMNRTYSARVFEFHILCIVQLCNLIFLKPEP